MSAGSVSKFDLVLSLSGRTRTFLEIKRHLAPKTAGVIARALPLEGNAHIMGASVAFMDTSLSAGGEKLRTRFKKGDVAFLAANGSIWFFLEDSPQTKPMTLVGKITSDTEVLRQVKPGDIFTLDQAGA